MDSNYCPKCNQKYEDDSRHCKHCGKKLVDFEQHNKKKITLLIKKKTVSIILGLIILVALISGAIIFFYPYPYIAQEGYTNTIPYEDIEYYYEKEPYTTSDCSQKNMIYKISWGTIDSECLNQECDSHASYCVEKNIWGNCIEFNEYCSQYKCTKYNKYCSIIINNQEREQGYFKVGLYKYDYDKKESVLIDTVDIYVSPIDQREVNWEYTYSSSESVGCWYTLMNSPTRTECQTVTKVKDVQKSRTVTKYRTEQQTRSVTKFSPLYYIWTNQVQYYYET